MNLAVPKPPFTSSQNTLDTRATDHHTTHRPQVNAPGAAPADAGGPVAMAVGSRAHLANAALAKRSRLRNFLMHGFHALVTFVAGHAVADTQCGFKVGGLEAGGGG